MNNMKSSQKLEIQDTISTKGIITESEFSNMKPSQEIKIQEYRIAYE